MERFVPNDVCISNKWINTKIEKNEGNLRLLTLESELPKSLKRGMYVASTRAEPKCK